MTEPNSPDGQAALSWDEERSRIWLASIDARERQLEPVSDALFEHAGLQPGETVLDVGCGSGVTTARAAGLVAPEVGGHTPGLEETGRVVGNDISVSMIDAARDRHPRSAIEWLVADAESHDFGVAAFDAVISRFGVMFFTDPAAAFANLAAATRPGGRLACVVWQPPADVEFFTVPLGTAMQTLDRLGLAYEQPLDDGTGPFSLSDPERVRELLSGAGWSAVWCHPDHRPVYLGGPGDAEHAVTSALHTAMMESLLTGQPEDAVADVHDALLAMAHERHDGAGVSLNTALWIITALRSE